MKQIILTIKKFYLRGIEAGEQKGICLAVAEALSDGKITNLEAALFEELLDETRNKQDTFYNFFGREVTQSSQFFWKVVDVESRLKWFDEQLTKYE